MISPLREVRLSKENKNDWTHDFRVLILSCGHHLIRQPAQKIPKRARCHHCAKAAQSETAP